MTLVDINVETRPQYGTCRTIILGVFDDEDKKNAAIAKAKELFKSYQNIVTETEVVVNKSLIDA